MVDQNKKNAKSVKNRKKILLFLITGKPSSIIICKNKKELCVMKILYFQKKKNRGFTAAGNSDFWSLSAHFF